MGCGKDAQYRTDTRYKILYYPFFFCFFAHKKTVHKEVLTLSEPYHCFISRFGNNCIYIKYDVCTEITVQEADLKLFVDT
jgi:hypothetical protein